VTHRELPSLGECLKVDPLTYLAAEGIEISRHRTNHPGKCYGYRIGPPERSVIFMPDNELNPPGYRWTTVDQLAEFCRGAKILIHDAQFMPEDMPAKRGWGHSLVGEACELAASAGVEHLVLFHHDPERTDDQLDKIESDYREWFLKHAPATKVSVGKEGMALKL
jgi:ribonuclease BN (tRNA processing enzyme)